MTRRASINDKRQGLFLFHDYEYWRCGVCSIFIACEPLAGKRIVAVTEKMRIPVERSHPGARPRIG